MCERPETIMSWKPSAGPLGSRAAGQCLQSDSRAKRKACSQRAQRAAPHACSALQVYLSSLAQGPMLLSKSLLPSWYSQFVPSPGFTWHLGILCIVGLFPSRWVSRCTEGCGEREQTGQASMVSAAGDRSWILFLLQNKCSLLSAIVLAASSSQSLQSHIPCGGPHEESGSILFALSTLQRQSPEALVFLLHHNHDVT